jgi:XapX domain-containing protein
MKAYLAAAAVGLLVGIVYAMFNVRSPAPPVVALVGLLAILVGEQIPPLVRQVLKVGITHPSWLQDQVKPHVFGELPRCKPLDATAQHSPVTLPAERGHG